MHARVGCLIAALLATGSLGGLMMTGVPSAAGATSQGIITTRAGGPGRGLVKNVSQSPDAVAVGADGAVYLGDDLGVVREFTATLGWERVTAGLGGSEFPGFSGDGGPAVRARLGSVYGVVVDAAANVVIADSNNSRVRVVAHTSGTFYGRAMVVGDIYTVAGNGHPGYSGDGGPATSAELNFPQGVAVDAAGNLVVADGRNARVRVVAARSGTFYGRAMAAGDIYTVAGNGIVGYSGDGGPATSAELNFRMGLAVDGAGNLVIADTVNNRVRVVAARSGTFYGQAMVAGHIYTVAGNGTAGYSGDGGSATSARLWDPAAVVVDGSGNLVIADTVNNRVRVVAARSGTFYGQAMVAGHIYTVAGNGTAGFSGNGGPAISAELGRPAGVAVDRSGNLVIAGSYRMRVVAAASGTFYRQAMVAGDIYTAAGNGLLQSSGNRGKAINAELLNPGGIATSGSGNYVVADNNQVRMVAVTSGTFFGQAMVAGDIYAVAGNGHPGYSGDGGPAASARVRFPAGVAVDRSGNLVIADGGNSRVRVVAASSGTFYGQAMAAGDIYTVAGNGHFGFTGDRGPAPSAELNFPSGVAFDASGNLVISDENNNRVRVVAASSGTFYGQAMAAGDIYTVAGNGAAGYSGDGGPATTADLWGPGGVAFDRSGNLVIADGANSRVRVVAASSGTFYGQAMAAGDIYTIAGNGVAGYSGDGGPATSAELNFPSGVAFDASGNLIIADTVNHRVRVVAATSGSFYGQAMAAGKIYTVAGNGKQGFSGDTGPATSARLSDPAEVVVDGSGNLVIVDSGNGRVRMVNE